MQSMLVRVPGPLDMAFWEPVVVLANVSKFNPRVNIGFWQHGVKHKSDYQGYRWVAKRVI